MTATVRPPSATCDREDHRLCTGLTPALSRRTRPCGCDCHGAADSIHAVRRALDPHGVPADTVTARPDGLYAIARTYGGTVVIGPEHGRDGGLNGWTWTVHDDRGEHLFTDGTERPLRDAALKLAAAVTAPHTAGWEDVR